METAPFTSLLAATNLAHIRQARATWALQELLRKHRTQITVSFPQLLICTKLQQPPADLPGGTLLPSVFNVPLHFPLNPHVFSHLAAERSAGVEAHGCNQLRGREPGLRLAFGIYEATPQYTHNKGFSLLVSHSAHLFSLDFETLLNRTQLMGSIEPF